MVRLITLTLFLAFISLVNAQLNMINTPSGDISQGATILVTWSLIGPTTLPGTLEVINKDTQNTTIISNNLDLNTKQLSWLVNVAPGTYNFALNDGSGNKFSGPFTVVIPPAPMPQAGPPQGPPQGAPQASPQGPVPKIPPAKRALPASTTATQPSQYQATSTPKTNAASSTKSGLLSLLGVAVIMIHFA
ncbi:hypothetical protein C1645_790385 [Glomus cerebriforme]|uniref:Ser-Thr-rich glycosyl-phosphatidyl-inositol-anchored membrane family-domain-containing protein n=1 Tax=Glomus cerebriforme TaxID=658196 RepID=A0A397S4X9_9GLOM|nr:hypothetical protein C1645_790385 [Glomus cerebriforme]